MTQQILIAEDEAHIRILIEQSLEELEDEGVALRFACDGLETLDMALSSPPELLLLDVMMPGMSGFDVCERLRASPGMSRTRIIFLTAKGQEYDRGRGEALGADAYLTKPFNPDQLLVIARKTLGLSVD